MLADVAIVVAYGLLLPRAILDAPAQGCLNLHASLLPRWRGAAPIQRALMAGDSETGIGVMRMEEGLDTGPVAREARLPLAPDTTAGDAHDALAALGARLAVLALADLAQGLLRFTPQAAEGVVYASKIDKSETALDWRQPAETLRDHVRGLSPAPGAYFEADLGRGSERVKVLRAQLSDRHGTPGALLDDRADDRLRHRRTAARRGATRWPRADAGRRLLAWRQAAGGRPAPRRLMPRYRLTLEYDGTPFVGWQRQANGLAVQQAVEDALCALCGTPVRITGAGRTDGRRSRPRSGRACRSRPRLARRTCCATR